MFGKSTYHIFLIVYIFDRYVTFLFSLFVKPLNWLQWGDYKHNSHITHTFLHLWVKPVNNGHSLFIELILHEPNQMQPTGASVIHCPASSEPWESLFQCGSAVCGVHYVHLLRQLYSYLAPSTFETTVYSSVRLEPFHPKFYLFC